MMKKLSNVNVISGVDVIDLMKEYDNLDCSSNLIRDINNIMRETKKSIYKD